MTDLTAQEILDAIERGLAATERRFKDKNFPRDGRYRPLSPSDEPSEPTTGRADTFALRPIFGHSRRCGRTWMSELTEIPRFNQANSLRLIRRFIGGGSDVLRDSSRLRSAS